MTAIKGYATETAPIVSSSNNVAGNVKSRAGSADPINGGTVADAANVSVAGSIVAQASAGSDVRTAKVAALQAAIAGGTYNVSSGDVADKVISNLLEGR